MKYKVGNHVRIKNIDWYNKNKDINGNVHCGDKVFDDYMSVFCGSVVTIEGVCYNGYVIREDMQCRAWTDTMIEGLVKEENNDCEKCGLIRNSTGCLFMDNCPHNKQKNIIVIPEDYIIKDENGNIINATKIVLEKKGKGYPKTYEECCKVLDWNHRDYDRVGYKSELLCKLQVLLLCRDAYWKIAGEEMGLGKPWKLSIGTPIYYIYYNRTVGTIKNDHADDIQGNIILAFPTAEMRDAFYENFKELIESCKELL